MNATPDELLIVITAFVPLNMKCPPVIRTFRAYPTDNGLAHVLFVGRAIYTSRPPAFTAVGNPDSPGHFPTKLSGFNRTGGGMQLIAA